MMAFRAFCLCFLGLLLALPLTRAAQAGADYRPAIIYESEGGGDKAFIDMMKKGAGRARTEVGINYEEFRMPAGADRTAFMKQVCESGVTNIIAVGFENVMPVLNLAEKYPEVKFTVIDGMVPPLFSNVQSIIFKDQEGAFLVGMVAGYLSPTNKVGFIGGLKAPLIENFKIGYYQGAKYANPNIMLLEDTVGDTAAAWNNPERAKSLAKKQFNSGAGVIFAAAGGSSLGVLQAAQEMGKYAIGVDTNQNGLYPGTVLTSMVKRVDRAVYDALTNGYSGKWKDGITYLGIRENALDYAVDVNNKDLITKDVIDKVEDAKDRIIRGLIVVEGYTQGK